MGYLFPLLHFEVGAMLQQVQLTGAWSTHAPKCPNIFPPKLLVS